MTAIRTAVASALAATVFLYTAASARAQVVAEPAFLTAGVPSGETFLPYLALPENALVLGGMLRFPVNDDVDIGGRAGLALVDNGEDTPFVGADVRYALLGRTLEGGGLLHLSFDVGVGLSDPGVTIWKVPLGFIAGVGFRLAGGDSEIFTHPRLEFGISSGDDSTDSALALDFGGVFTISPRLGFMVDFRFGNGVYEEGDQVVVGLGALWRI
jgi:hypothetical protein